MPGGRGTIVDIAASLDCEEHKEVKHDLKMAIDSGYRVQVSGVNAIRAAHQVCSHSNSLSDVWCHAVNKGAVDWGDY